VFRDNGGFDIVIGNPPYIGFHNVPNKDYFKNKYISANGKYDFYVLFIEEGLKLLSSRGIISFICPSYFYKRNYGKNIRNLLLDKTNIKYIADFADYQIFDSALTYTCIFGAQNGRIQNENVKILGESLNEQNAYYIQQDDLKEPSWNLEKSENNAILERIMSKTDIKFGDITKSISQGIVTGFNDIYLVNENVIAQYNLEKTYLERAYKGRDIRNGALIDTDTYIFYPYEIDKNGKTIPISEQIFKDTSPNMYEYLYSRKDDLLSREYFAKSSKQWFELWNCRKKEHFYNKKFVFAEINMFNDFALVEKCFYTDSACGAELKDEYQKFYKYLLLYLNSDVVTYIYKKVSVPKANGYSIYKNAFLKELPILLHDEDNLADFETMSQDEFNKYIRVLLGLSENENKLIEDTLAMYKEG
jgi:hypothetical protein